jgi:hypothetical protein
MRENRKITLKNEILALENERVELAKRISEYDQHKAEHDAQIDERIKRKLKIRKKKHTKAKAKRCSCKKK